MRRWFRAAWVLAVLVLSACTSQVVGAPRADPRAVPTSKPDSAAELIGDANALDPCALLDPAALSQFGTAETPAQESYDYCWLKLPMSGASVAVRFGLLEHGQPAQAREVEPVGLLRVFEQSPVPDRCARYVVFGDNVTMAVSADTADSPGVTVSQLCSVTEKAANVIAATISGRRVVHRAYPGTSFGPLDACKAAVTSLGQVPGLAAAQVSSYPAHHQCRWGSATVPSLTVRYVLASPSGAANVRHETIDGKPSGVYTVDIGGPTLCVAEVKGDNGELAQVIVRMAPGDAEVACRAVQVVAGEVWSKLPLTG
jgi:hypothetical protein